MSGTADRRAKQRLKVGLGVVYRTRTLPWETACSPPHHPMQRPVGAVMTHDLRRPKQAGLNGPALRSPASPGTSRAGNCTGDAAPQAASAPPNSTPCSGSAASGLVCGLGRETWTGPALSQR